MTPIFFSSLLLPFGRAPAGHCGQAMSSIKWLLPQQVLSPRHDGWLIPPCLPPLGCTYVLPRTAKNWSDPHTLGLHWTVTTSILTTGLGGTRTLTPKLGSERLIRYANPPQLIYRFLNMPSKNMGSICIFRVAIYLWNTKLDDMWESWKWKYVESVIKLLRISCTIQILS